MQVSRQLTGGSDSIDFGPVSLFNGLTALTVRIVFDIDQSLVTAFGGGDPPRSWLSLWSTSAMDAQGFFLGQDPSDTLGKVRFSVADTAGNIVTVVSANPVLKQLWPALNAQRHELVGVWSAAAFTRWTGSAWSTAAGQLRLYLDGQLIGSVTGQTAIAAMMGSPNGSLCIGASPGGTNAPVGLWVDHIGFWCAALDPGLVNAPQLSGMDAARDLNDDTIARMSAGHAPSGEWNTDVGTFYGSNRGTFLGQWMPAIRAGSNEVLTSGFIAGQPQASLLATATVTGTLRSECVDPSGSTGRFVRGGITG